MINQGERIVCTGKFQQKNNEGWSDITDLSSYEVSAMIVCEEKNKKLFFTSKSGAVCDGTITKGTGGSYEFAISEHNTIKLLGECTMEVSLKDASGNVIITDDKASFIVKESLLGRTITSV